MRDVEIGQVWLKVKRMVESCRTVRQLNNTERESRRERIQHRGNSNCTTVH